MTANEPTRTRQQGTRNTRTEGDPAIKMNALRQIVAEKQYAKIDGFTVDLFSASAIVAVHDKLGAENQARFLALPVANMAAIAMKLLK